MSRVLLIDLVLALATAGLAHGRIHVGGVTSFGGLFALSFAFWFIALPLVIIFAGVMST